MKLGDIAYLGPPVKIDPELMAQIKVDIEEMILARLVIADMEDAPDGE